MITAAVRDTVMSVMSVMSVMGAFALTLALVGAAVVPAQTATAAVLGL